MLPLSQTRITTILPVKDIQRARSFYEGKLGLSLDGEPRPDGTCVYQCGNSAIALYPKEGGTKAEHTALSFDVADIEEGVRTLKKAGVVFEDYDFPTLKTVNHICVLGAEKAAWFRDTEGNYLCLHQDLR